VDSVDNRKREDAEQEINPCNMHVDREGDWYYQGNRIIREDILGLFYENLQLGPDGRFLIEWRQTRCLLDAEDTPFVISRVDRSRKADSNEEIILLSLKHLSLPDTLDPTDLHVGEDNVLYCRVLSGRFPARFSRPAYYQLAEWIEEDPGTGVFYLEINHERHMIRTAGEA
jgi:uncharacterized protein